MKHFFFFSYSRDNDDQYLRKFYDDLNEAVGEKIGNSENGFIDQHGNEPGDFWEENLEEALANSRVFLAIVSASYCKKLYCGKEWAAFSHRVDQYKKTNNLISPPPLIIPLIWVPPVEEIAPFPQVIRDHHFHIGDAQLLANQKGLKHLVKLKARYSQQYENYISALAQRILNLAVEHAAFDVIASVPKFSEIDSPFYNQENKQLTNASVIKPAGGPKRVHFVYGACTPEQLKDIRSSSVEAYGENGCSEWQPYYPESRSIGTLAQQIASSDEIGMFSYELSLTEDLNEQVRKLEDLRELVVILLDCWSARLPSYKKSLQVFDKNNYFNCSVLIPWNDNDPESKNSEEILLSDLKETLKYRYLNGNDLFLRFQIPSEKDLREQIADVLTRLRAEMINRSSPSVNNIPSGGRSRPQISGPGDRS